MQQGNLGGGIAGTMGPLMHQHPYATMAVRK